MLTTTSRCEALAINSNVGLTPAKDQKILRIRMRATEKSRDPLASRRKEHIFAAPINFVYGFTNKFSTAVTIPILEKTQKITLEGIRTKREVSGIGDITILSKYRLLKKDVPGKTSRLSAVGGIKAPSGKSDKTDALGELPRPLQLGTGSWDYFLGLAFTRQTLDDEWDVSTIYELNTRSRGFEFGDRLKYTLAYQRRIYPRELPEKGLYKQYNIVFELNGEWAQKNEIDSSKIANSGGHILFASPGIQMASKRIVLEASVQLPIMQDLNGMQPKTRYSAVVSLRWTF